MAIISTSTARKHFSELIRSVRYSNRPVIIGRHNKAEVLMIKFPMAYNSQVSTITNMNQYGGAFDFLEHDDELYTIDDLKKSYV